MSEPKKYSLTAPRITAEPSPEKGEKSIVWDTTVGGLCVRINPSGDRSFYFSKWVKGAQRWIKIGDHPGVSVSDARDAVHLLLADIAKDGRPWETKKQLAKEATLTDLWNHYHEHHAKVHKRPGSLKQDEMLWRNVLCPWGGNRRVSAISRGDVQSMVNTKGKSSHVMANRALALLSTMFSRAIVADLWKGGNPAKGVERFPEKSRDRFLQQSELKALFASLVHEPEPWGLFFFASILAGARKSNLLSARWDGIDLQRGNWTVEAEEAKAGKKLVIVLPAALIDALALWRTKQAGASPWVFPAEDKRNHLVEPKRPWKRVLLRAEAFRLVGVIAELKNWSPADEQAQQERVLEECGALRVRAMGRWEKLDDDPMALVLAALRLRVKEAGADPDERGMLDLRIHDMRRTLGSWSAMNGASLTVIGKMLGHRSMISTEIYARLNMDPVRNAAEAAATKMLSFR